MQKISSPAVADVPDQRRSLLSSAWRISLFYVLFAGIWIFSSDAILGYLVDDPRLIVNLSTYKGLVFVLVTGLLLLFLVRRAFAEIGEGYKAREDAYAHATKETLFSQAIIESMPGVLYFYDRQGKFLRWNKNFEEVTGYSSDEIRNMHPLDFIAPEDSALVSERIDMTFRTGTAQVEAGLQTRSGVIPYFFTGRRVSYEGQDHLVGVGIDISEQKQAERALVELNNTLEQRIKDRTRELQAAVIRAESADQLKSSFLATMSHELRTPLNSIIGFTGIILQEMPGPLNKEQAKQLKMVQGSAKHLLDLINDVLDLSKIEAGQLELHFEHFAPQVLLDDIFASLRPLAKAKDLKFQIHQTDIPESMKSDPRRVRQILLNLLNNAIKFTDEGSVTLHAEMVNDSSPGNNRYPEKALRLRIIDTGIGLSDADICQLFLPFRQLDNGLTRQREGTGLGLVICRKLLDMLGGDIQVVSRIGEGSEFTVQIPQAGDVSTGST